MNMQELKKIIASLARSQGYYGRLKQQLDAEGSWRDFLTFINENNVKSALDLVFLIEG